MPSFLVGPRLLTDFCTTAFALDLSYHKNRKILWDLFTILIRSKGNCLISYPNFVSIKSYLNSRSEDLNSASSLAFITTIGFLFDSISLVDLPSIGKDEV